MVEDMESKSGQPSLPVHSLLNRGNYLGKAEGRDVFYPVGGQHPVSSEGYGRNLCSVNQERRAPVVYAPPAVPTVADAQRAAEVLTSAGARRVLLFGSVARGEAGDGSDIDLVAVFADIDYGARRELARHLEVAAREVAGGWPVQVVVTDLPEWRNRVANVSASFESAISSDAVLVAESTARRPVRWDKEMVLPMSNPDEALKQFSDRVLSQLAGLTEGVTASWVEEDLSAPSGMRETARLRRMVRVCTHAAMAVEVALKSLAVLHATPTPPAKVLRAAAHSISACLQLLPPRVRSVVEPLVTGRGLSADDLSQWRMLSAYPEDTAAVQALADQKVNDYAGTALDVCGFVVDDLRTVLGDTPEVQTAAYEWYRTAEYLGGIDIRVGRPGVGSSAPGPGLDL